MMALERLTETMTISQLLDGLARVDTSDDRDFSGLSIDSRSVKPGDLFIACSGQRHHGAEFIGQAVSAGAVAVLVEGDVTTGDYNVPVLAVEKLGERVGELAHRFFNCPSDALTVIGITGTNGKTSVSHFIGQALSADGSSTAGIIGTLGSGTPGKLQAGLNTTPDALSVHRLLAELREEGCKTVVMEVSSHALAQARVGAVSFDTGIFTNLSSEHLDYHGDMQSYGDAKRRLFDVRQMRTAIVNSDDDFGRRLATELPRNKEVITFGLGEGPGNTQHVRGDIRASYPGGLELSIQSPWGDAVLASSVSGSFNAGNLLAAFAALCVTGMPVSVAGERLAEVRPVPGRLEYFIVPGQPGVVVDYAHTPDALDKTLQSLREIEKGKIINVVGCGGDRDRSKRPMMAGISERYADFSIFTSDNPRSEDPMAIIEEMLTGVTSRENIQVILDRGLAIENAIALASTSDVVLVAGKGHETYQEINGVRTPFSDRQLVRNLLGVEQ